MKDSRQKSKLYGFKQRCRFGGYSMSFAAVSLAVSAAAVLSMFSGITAKTSNAAESEVFAVAELFTSQGCYSCPPADALFGEIIEKYPDVVALEYHVDYWDALVHGNDGSWKDLFSDPEYTAKQQAYNISQLEGRRGVYTPQMVVNGSYAAVGSQRRFVENALTTLPSPALKLEVTPIEAETESGETTLNVSALATSENLPLKSGLWLVVFHQQRSTDITAGENSRKTLINHHIVTSISPIGRLGNVLKTDVPDAEGRLLLAENVTVKLEEGQGCAVLIQDDLPGTIHAAGYCDRSVWK